MSDSEEDYYPSADEDEPKWYDDYGTALAVKPAANYGKMKVEKAGFMKMNKKIPPFFDGKKSWFSYEDELDDWVELTEEPPEKQGILVKHRLIEDAEYWRHALDNTLLKKKNGIKYLKDTLRPHYVKGASLLFLWRFLSLVNLRKPRNMEMLHWIPRVHTKKKRTLDAWMNCADQIKDKKDPKYLQYVQDQNEIIRRQHASGTASAGAPSASTAAEGGDPTPAEAQAKAKAQAQAKSAAAKAASVPPAEAEQEGDQEPWFYEAEDDDTLEMYNNTLKEAHREKFPLNDNVMALLFIVSSELNESQRERLISTMTLQGMKIEDITPTQLEDIFRDLFASARTSFQDPFVSRGT